MTAKLFASRIPCSGVSPVYKFFRATIPIAHMVARSQYATMPWGHQMNSYERQQPNQIKGERKEVQCVDRHERVKSKCAATPSGIKNQTTCTSCQNEFHTGEHGRGQTPSAQLHRTAPTWNMTCRSVVKRASRELSTSEVPQHATVTTNRSALR